MANIITDFEKKLIIRKAEEKGLTLYRTALLSNIVPSNLYQIMNRHVPLYPKWRNALSDTLDITPEEWKNTGIVYEKIDDGGDVYE